MTTTPPEKERDKQNPTPFTGKWFLEIGTWTLAILAGAAYVVAIGYAVWKTLTVPKLAGHDGVIENVLPYFISIPALLAIGAEWATLGSLRRRPLQLVIYLVTPLVLLYIQMATTVVSWQTILIESGLIATLGAGIGAPAAWAKIRVKDLQTKEGRKKLFKAAVYPGWILLWVGYLITLYAVGSMLFRDVLPELAQTPTAWRIALASVVLAILQQAIYVFKELDVEVETNISTPPIQADSTPRSRP